MAKLRWCVPLLLVSVWSSPVLAKGPTTRIVISAPGLASAVEVTDPALLREFNIWSGPGVLIGGREQSHGFIVDWSRSIDRPPAGLVRYEVSFYVKSARLPLEEQRERLAYVVFYELDPARGGYVYLPGKGDSRYLLNSQTIYRGREGRWFHATDAWSAAAKRALAVIED